MNAHTKHKEVHGDDLKNAGGYTQFLRYVSFVWCSLLDMSRLRQSAALSDPLLPLPLPPTYEPHTQKLCQAIV